MTKQRQVATGASYGGTASEHHARQAVTNAIAQLEHDDIGSVLLFLSGGYAHHPQQAIRQAVKASGTPQVLGCCAAGLLYDHEWILDAEGAVAMVFARDISLLPSTLTQQLGIEAKLALTLSSPNAVEIACAHLSVPQIGAVCSDEFGQGPYSLWQSGRVVEREYFHATVPTTLQHKLIVSDGIRRLSPILQINRAQGHRLFEVGEKPAVDSLLRHLPTNLQSAGLEQPYNVLCAVSENKRLASIQQGHYSLQHVVSTSGQPHDARDQEICISGQASAGQHLFWALRDAELAQLDLQKRLSAQKDLDARAPKFALMFSNISRGAQFYSGPDRDFDLFKQAFPDTPMLGFYGNSEITPGYQQAASVRQYSCAISLFY